MDIGARIRQFRLARRLSQRELGDAIGVERSMVAKYEAGKHHLRPQLLLSIAEVLGVTINDLYGLPPQAELAMVEVPILGRVAADRLVLAEQDIEGHLFVPADLVRGGECFYLCVDGDCMAPQIPNGALALVRRQPDVEDGEPAVVIANNEEGTLKRVYRLQDGKILLRADNPLTLPIVTDAHNVRIVGKVIAVTSAVR